MNPTLTHYHIKYYTMLLSGGISGYSRSGIERIAGVLSDAQVDVNPHQIEAALFAMRSPFSKGVILGDEVGLGKTIEACIVMAQLWAEDKRCILVIVPANLKTQWQAEIEDKFYLPAYILDSENYKVYKKSGVDNPFIQDGVMIMSYNYAYENAHILSNIPWDLVVMDEAHKMRNAYKQSNIIGRTLLKALENRKKLLLTATPLHNSILELYGLSRFIDDYIFGNVESFKTQFSFMRDEDNKAFSDLAERCRQFCIRTLRRQVSEYINYTERQLITQEFEPISKEQEFYDLFTSYLQRDKLWTLPSSGRSLVSMILWKLLASSTFAIAGTLEKLIARLEVMYERGETVRNVKFRGLDDGTAVDSEEVIPEIKRRKLTASELISLKKEIDELRGYYGLARSITKNAKGEALLTALEKGFEQLKILKAPQKAVIFTESRRTQEYLAELLTNSKYKNKFALYYGGMTPKKQEEAKENFKNKIQILIATESAAEGLNLQFCPMVINYDLPFNPQRIEQRIGRIHRYGQKHDVVVINFLNKNNIADQRVYELLCNKFNLFEGVFGASDGILGDIDALDFEKRIVEILNTCRTSAEIEKSFNELRESLSPQIDEKMADIRQKLLENFDSVVAERLKMNFDNSTKFLNQYDRMLWAVTKHYIGHCASFQDDWFMLEKNPFAHLSGSPAYYSPTKGIYRFNRGESKSQRYRANHPIARRLIDDLELNKYRFIPEDTITFSLTNHLPKISALQPFIGRQGTMAVYEFRVRAKSYDIPVQTYVICIARTNDGEEIPPELCSKLWDISGTDSGNFIRFEFAKDDYQKGLISSEHYSEMCENMVQYVADSDKKRLDELCECHTGKLLSMVEENDNNLFSFEMEKLDKWANDIKKSMEKNIREMDREIDELRKAVRKSTKIADRLPLERKLKEVEAKRSSERHGLYTEQDKIDKQKDELIKTAESKLGRTSELKRVFAVKWRIV